MDKFAKMPSIERNSVFINTAEKMGVSTAIIEKDFWVCWILEYLFSKFKYANSIFFKGGTSLSKAYYLISRFSEDIDLIIEWKELNYLNNEPYENRSNRKQDAFNKEANERTALFLEHKVLPVLEKDMKEILVDSHKLYIDEVDKQTICFEYPRSFEDNSILQVIRLEIGPLAESIPSNQVEIKTYIEEYYPNLFEHKDTKINTVSPIRTFFEKLTILHQEANRKNNNYPQRYSRHYYDVFQMINSSVGDDALGNMDILFKVIEFKEKFYPCGWANYDVIKKGKLKLVPTDDVITIFLKDYNNMKNMLFGEYPSFPEIVEELQKFEIKINSLIKTSLSY